MASLETDSIYSLPDEIFHKHITSNNMDRQAQLSL